MSLFHRQTQLFLSLYVDDITLAGRRTSLQFYVAQVEEKTDLEKPTPLIDQVNSGCTQRESVRKESNVKNKSGLFAKVTTLDTKATFEIQGLEKESRILEPRPEGHAATCVERYCDLAHRSIVGDMFCPEC